MTSVKIAAILALFSFSALSPACRGISNNSANSSSSPPANQANANGAKSDIEELGLFITIPYDTEDAVWKNYSAQKRIVAVLRFSPEDTPKLVADLEKLKQPEAVTITSETWFPSELTAQSEVTGEDALNGHAYAAIPFFQEPYTSGRLVRVDNTDFFVLDVTGK